MSFKYLEKELSEKKLELFKTADFCEAEKPRLTVIFVHGIAADSSSFSKVLELLRTSESMREIRFATFDLLGSGKSFTSDALEYNFEEQLEALSNSVKKLNIKTPVILVGHSMGTLIATRFANKNPELIREMILVSPPVYREEDVKSPAFGKAMDGFRMVMSRKNPAILKEKAFENEIKNIISNTENYKFLVETCCPTTLIYGALDEIIARFNIPKVLEKNPQIRAVETPDSHGITTIKAEKILKELERILGETV